MPTATSARRRRSSSRRHRPSVAAGTGPGGGHGRQLGGHVDLDGRHLQAPAAEVGEGHHHAAVVQRREPDHQRARRDGDGGQVPHRPLGLGPRRPRGEEPVAHAEQRPLARHRVRSRPGSRRRSPPRRGRGPPGGPWPAPTPPARRARGRRRGPRGRRRTCRPRITRSAERSGWRWLTQMPSRRALTDQLTARRRSPGAYGRTSANSSPSPRTRARWLPAMARGSAACSRARVDAGPGSTRSVVDGPTAPSHRTSPSGPWTRTHTGPTVARPQCSGEAEPSGAGQRRAACRSTPARRGRAARRSTAPARRHQHLDQAGGRHRRHASA